MHEKEPMIVCTPKSLPLHSNAPLSNECDSGEDTNGLRIVGIRKKLWQIRPVHLTVSFLDNPEKELRDLILLHMNAWGRDCSIEFRYTEGTGDIRISRFDDEENHGYWSYVGTDVLYIDRAKPTMNLEGFTKKTPESEFFRVVRHETGHTLGFPHEHMRKELVDQIDPELAYAFYSKTQGWSREQVLRQVLTPLEESTLLGTPHPDPNSIMCYQIPGSITKSGRPILGGADISTLDYEFVKSIYCVSGAFNSR
jgi:hypothetical protein